MATNYPTSLDDGTTLPEPTTGASIPAADDTNRSQAIKALEAKVGVNSSTPAANQVLRSGASGESDWGQVEIADVNATGTASSSTFLRGDGSWAAPSGGGGGDMLAANNLSDVSSASTSFDNIKQAASTTATGVVELATNAETTTGTDTTRAVTPAGVKAVADTKISADSTDTLTNKTIDADGTGNSITNLANSNIKLGAAINAAKIADGSVNNTEFQYLDGVTSDIQTQLDGKAASSHTHTHADITDYDTELAGKTNTTAFTPTADYHVATKKYVDDNAGGGGASQLSDLSDVNTSTATSGNVLRADGTDWESTTLAIDDISDVDTDKSKTPADGDVLTFDGTHWNAEAASGGGGGGSSFDSPWYTVATNTGDGLNKYVAGSYTAATYGVNGIDTYVGVTGGTGIRQSLYKSTNQPMSGFKGFSAITECYADGHASLTHDIFIGCGDAVSSNAGSDISQTANHVGFLFSAASGTLKIYATNANGTTQTKTEIYSATAGSTVRQTIRAIYDGTDIKFYIDGTLEATHTTNIPTATVYRGWGMQMDKKAGSSGRYMSLRVRESAHSWE